MRWEVGEGNGKACDDEQSLPEGASGAWTWKWWSDRWRGFTVFQAPYSSSSDSRDLCL